MVQVGIGQMGGGAEAMLGRRLRPWWGTAPGRLALRGAIGVAVFGLVVYGCFQVRSGEIDLAGTGFEDRRDLIDRVALGVAAVAALGVVYRLVQFVIGLLDLVPRRHVEGTVVSARERHTGDFLPGIVQHFWFRTDDIGGRSRHLTRRTRYQVVLDTADGPQSWNVRLRLFSHLRAGTRVRLTASPILGHVSGIVPLDDPRDA